MRATRIFNALGNEIRVKIILLVNETKRPLHIKGIAQALTMDYAALYRHVQVLERNGLVEIYNVGRSRVLSLKNADLLIDLIDIAKKMLH
ncbi:MAG: winged helix-turn-helix transcriptional regulator [Candidatus Bathyarchaeota archaeon]|nr:MAG: winged helix-turn-helix transcriptional regulator [Candidatus Bathyarchaeota archaeon]